MNTLSTYLSNLVMDEVAQMLHQDYTTQLNKEYHILWNNPDILFNYRDWPNQWPKRGAYHIYNQKYNIYSNHAVAFLPNRYFYTSGYNDFKRYL